MLEDLEFFRDDLGEEEKRQPRQLAAVDTLAMLALADALPPTERRRVAAAPSFGLVVEAPTAAWVEPLRRACEERATWSSVFARTGSSRSEDRPDKGGERVADVLGRGGRVLGVSQAPERYLPAALLTAADRRLRIEGASNRVIERAIRMATGQRPKAMPTRIAGGLDLHEIGAAIRLDSSAASAIARLIAAARSKAVVDPAVADAPAFRELRGFGEAHEWGLRLLAGLDAWRAGGPFPPDRNVVLASEPGLGKTTFVRALAKEARLPLVATSVAAWFANSSGNLDGVVKQIQEVFSVSECIVLIDEIDALPNRATMSERAREWWTPVVTQILLLLDSATSSGVARGCVIGATNLGHKLDPALVRPGRLNRIIEIRRPHADDLAVIFRQHLGSDLADMDLRLLGELAVGASGAQVAAWVQQARALALAAGRRLRPEDLIAVAAPAETRSPGALRRTALHEAAHCLAAEILGAARVEHVSIVGRGPEGGFARSTPLLPNPPTLADLERAVVSLLAGRAAEIVLTGAPTAGAGGSPESDLARATELIAGVHGSLGLGARLAYLDALERTTGLLRTDREFRREVETHLVELHDQAETFVRDHSVLIEDIADRLLARRALGGDEIRAVIAASMTRPAHEEAR